MAISYVRAGGTSGGTTTTFVPYPTSPTAGNLLLLIVANKHDEHTASTPSGWTAPANNSFTGGLGTEGTENEGTVRITIFYRVATGSESGNVQVTTSGDSVCGIMAEFSRSAGTGWDLACAGGSDDVAGTSWSVTMGSDPGINAGDMLVAVSGINNSTYTYSSPSFSATGATFTSTFRTSTSTGNGANCLGNFSTITVDTGPASAAGTYTMTASGSATNSPTGATVLVRLREIPAGLSITSVTPSSFDDGTTGIVVAGSGFGSATGTVAIAGVSQTVTAWSDTSITVTSVLGTNKYGPTLIKVTPA